MLLALSIENDPGIVQWRRLFCKGYNFGESITCFNLGGERFMIGARRRLPHFTLGGFGTALRDMYSCVVAVKLNIQKWPKLCPYFQQYFGLGLFFSIAHRSVIISWRGTKTHSPLGSSIFSSIHSQLKDYGVYFYFVIDRTPHNSQAEADCFNH